MDPELQAQLAHLMALINELDRKLDELAGAIADNSRKLDDMADQLSIEIIDNTDD